MQCPKCGSHAEHIFTIEQSSKPIIKWAIERCPRCNYTGWPDNPIAYADHIRRRADKSNGGRIIRDSKD